MPSARLTSACALAVIALAGCGAVKVKPTATRTADAPASRGRIDDPAVHKPNRVQCLRADGLTVRRLGPDDLALAGGVRVHFAPTAGTAQGYQIEDREQGAEVIGTALLYPGQASDHELGTIEECLDLDVTG